MPSTIRNRQHDSFFITVTKELLIGSIPRDMDHCTVAKGMQEQCGIYPSIFYDFTTGDVIAVWQQPEEGRIRNYSGIVEPNKLATQIVMGTDIDVKKLVRMCPDEGWELTVNRVESRFKQVSTNNRNPNRNRGTSTKRKPRRVMARVSKV